MLLVLRFVFVTPFLESAFLGLFLENITLYLFRIRHYTSSNIAG